jgi:imidazolonepropionase-like amidohydrolase
MRFHIPTLSMLLCAAFAATLQAQDTPQAFTGAHIIPIVGNEIANGTIIVQGGKITAVGPAASTAIPANAQRHDASGKVIMPGLVDTHSHIGNVEGGDGSAAIQPDVRVIDSINVRDARIQKAQAGGLTAVNIMPGSGHLLSGQTLYVKLRDGNVIDDILIRDSEGRIAGVIKKDNGTNSRRESSLPGTSAKNAAMVREK